MKWLGMRTHFHTIQSILKPRCPRGVLHGPEYFHTIQSILKLVDFGSVSFDEISFPYYSVYFKASADEAH